MSTCSLLLILKGPFAHVLYISPIVIKKASMSDDNCVLFVMGIPVHSTKDELFEHFSRRTERLQSVTTRPSSNFNSPNRGFCFLEYANHSYAAQARRELLLDPYVQEWRSEITVNWSIPDKQKNDPAYEPSKNIFVNNLPEDINFQRLMSFLAQHMDVSHYVNCKVIGTKAFIGFTSRDEAEFALHIIEGMKIGDRVLHASWARPMQKNRDRDRLLKQDYASCNARLRFPSISEESENHSPSHSPCSGYTAGSVQEEQPNHSFDLRYTGDQQLQQDSSVSPQSEYYSSSYASNFAISNCNINLNNIQLREAGEGGMKAGISNPKYRGGTPLPNLMSARSFVAIPNVNYTTSLSPQSPLTPLAYPQFNYSSWSGPMSPNLMSTSHSPAFVYPSPNVMYRTQHGVLPAMPSTPTTPVFNSAGGNYFRF
uniref:RNA-binding protein 47 n=1 Tax=Cacopsylla melanoneura TaxID=428564 RepID=A0A8D8QUB8_9HEMI